MCKECGCAADKTERQTINVPGISCGHCKEVIEAALLKLPGVMAADVNVETKDVVIDFKGTEVSTAQIVAAIEAVGFDVDKDAIVEKASSGLMGMVSKLFK